MAVFAVLAVLAFVRGNPTSGPSEGDRIQARVIIRADRNHRRDAFFVNPSHIPPEEVEALVESELLPILTYREAQRDERTCTTGQCRPYDDPMHMAGPHGGRTG